jgi:hypothetical protein
MRTLRRLALVLAVLAAAFPAAAQPLEGAFFLSDPVPTADPDRRLFILSPTPGRANPGGFVIDPFGNFYISDQGDGEVGDGSVIMLPADGRTPVRFITGLTKPGDLELSVDRRALIIGLPSGQVLRRVFGISAHVLNTDLFAQPTIVYAKTDFGTKGAPVSADGYAHILDILVPGQTSPTVDIVVERDGTTRTLPGFFLGQPGETGQPTGQAIVDVPF